MENNLVQVERNGHITLYGRIIGTGGRLGQYEVSAYGKMFGPYPMYSEAEKVFKKLTAPKTVNSNI